MFASRALTGLLLATSMAAEAATYQLTDISAHDGTHVGINRHGAVTSAVRIVNDYHAYVFEDGNLRLLEAAGPSNFGNAINDRGDVAGECQGRQEHRTKACIWTTVGLRKFKGLFGNYMVTVDGINNARQVAGSTYVNLGDVHPYRYDNGVVTDLGTLGGTGGYASGINKAGHVSGYSLIARNNSHYHAFIHDGSQMKDLGTLRGGTSIAYGLNDADVAVGTSDLKDHESHAVIFEDGQVRDLGTLGGSNSAALAINNRGVIVGRSDTKTPGRVRGFIYRDGRMTELDNHLDPLSGTGWTVTEAAGVNDRGEIVALGYHEDRPTFLRVLMLTPME